MFPLMNRFLPAAFVSLLVFGSHNEFVHAGAFKSHSPTRTHSRSTSAPEPARTTSPANVIQWGPCDPSIVPDPSLSCGFFEIPLDYHDLSAGKGRLAVVKANATAERRGTVFMNPGGPGASGLQVLATSASSLLAVTGGVYDVVSWDPRGVGTLSVPGEVYCFGSVEEYDALFAGTIQKAGISMHGDFTDGADIARLLDQADGMQEKYEEMATRCLAHSDGKYLKYVGSAATARDVVALADALDGPGAPVNYFGFSYGTRMGSWLINMFPDRVGKVVLDSVFDPSRLASVELATAWSPQLSSADRAYEGFVTGCALAGPEHCTIAKEGDTPAKLHADIQAQLKLAHDAELRDPSSPVTSGALRTSLYPVMYWPSQWQSTSNQVLPGIFQAISAEAQNVNSNLSEQETTLPRSLSRRAENETRSFSASAILCADGPATVTVNSTMKGIFEAIVKGTQTVSHMFGAQWPFSIYYCGTWPERSVEIYQGPFNKTLANKILLMGNTYDPATPFWGAKAVADLLGDQAALVRLNGFGHTLIANPSACINQVLAAYFLNGTLPEGDDTVCEVDDTFEIWPGVNTKMILGNMTEKGLEY